MESSPMHVHVHVSVNDHLRNACVTMQGHTIIIITPHVTKLSRSEAEQTGHDHSNKEQLGPGRGDRGKAATEFR